jgi:hydrogenase-4 component F
MFFGAGIMMRAYGTKEIALIHGVGCRFPTEGALWLAGAIAITGAPPFGLFLSEFTNMRAGLKPPFSWAVYVMAILLIVIFIGFMNHFRAMYYQSTQSEESKGDRLSGWCVAPMWLSLIPLLVLGLWWPTHVWDYLASIAQSLNLEPQ